MARPLTPPPPDGPDDTVIHHFLCAHVGRTPTFRLSGGRRYCPKCHRPLDPDRSDWEMLDTAPVRAGHSVKTS